MGILYMYMKDGLILIGVKSAWGETRMNFFSHMLGLYMDVCPQIFSPQQKFIDKKHLLIGSQQGSNFQESQEDHWVL